MLIMEKVSEGNASLMMNYQVFVYICVCVCITHKLQVNIKILTVPFHQLLRLLAIVFLS